MQTTPILDVQHVSKTYHTGAGPLTVLKDISFCLAVGTTCAVVGPSGSGKTTLMGLCAGLDRPSSGTVILHGHTLNLLSEDALATLRNTAVGFVFQTFQLIPTLTALENVMVPVELRGDRRARAHAVDLLQRVGLGDRLQHYPVQLSGGEQQRVALARAFIGQPRILFADEPTGNLDTLMGEELADSLLTYCRSRRAIVIIATHNPRLAEACDRILTIQNGRLCPKSSAASENRGSLPLY